MKQTPILFSTPMVQAILEGRKTQTRRLVKDCSAKHLSMRENEAIGESGRIYKCPYGQICDLLYVKETFYAYGKWVKNGKSKTGIQKYKFIDLTDSKNPYMYYDCKPKKVLGFYDRVDGIAGYFKRNYLFMKKDACRFWLEITNVRVERLHNISEEDAKAEGIFKTHPLYGWHYMPNTYSTDSVLIAFERLWKSINSEKSWNDNPWIWVIEFERINIDK